MASAALLYQEFRWAIGNTITARLVSDFPVGWKVADGLPANAASMGTATVQTDGSVTITGLTASRKYRLTGTHGAGDAGSLVAVDYYVVPPQDAKVPSGGTDGQVLTADAASAGGVQWAAPAAGGIAATIVDAKGDLIVASAADTVIRKAVGTDGQVLQADAASAGGVKWGAAGSGDLVAANNLSDVPAPGTARGNLNVGVLQAAAAVSLANVASRSGTTTIDGVALIAGDIVLLTAQSTGSQNGPWVIAAGAWTRPTDFAAASSVRGRLVLVVGGTVGAGQIWTLRTTTAITVDTTAQTWALAAESLANTLVDAKGDIITATADNVPARLAVGTNGKALVASSGAATGLAYSDALSPYGASKLVMPISAHVMPTAVGVFVANRMMGVRFAFPFAGTIAGIATYVAVSSGNYRMGLYDTGDASATNRTQLAALGSTACPAVNGWRELWAPNFAVTAGQHIDIVLQLDNASASLSRLFSVQTGAYSFPTGYMAAPGGVGNKQFWIRDPGSFALIDPVSEANAGDPGTSTLVPFLLVRMA